MDLRERGPSAFREVVIHYGRKHAFDDGLWPFRSDLYAVRSDVIYMEKGG